MACLPSTAHPRRIFGLQNQPPAKHAESFSGLIERVTFFNEENGFAVLTVKAKGRRDQVTVVGSLPSVSAGEWVTAEGRWVQDREFGLQFRAEMLNSTAPTTREDPDRQAVGWLRGWHYLARRGSSGRRQWRDEQAIDTRR